MKCLFPSLCGAAAILLLATGCGETPRAATPAKPGSYQEGGGLSPFYAEELHENRLYVFGTKKVWEKFMQTKEMDPMNSKRLIGAGPEVDGKRMTLVVETTKDEPAKDKRIIETVKSRYGLTKG